MTGNLRVTPEKLISTSTQFGQSDSKVNTLTQSMMDIANQLNSTWAGEAATGYYTKLKGLQADRPIRRRRRPTSRPPTP